MCHCPARVMVTPVGSTGKKGAVLQQIYLHCPAVHGAEFHVWAALCLSPMEGLPWDPASQKGPLCKELQGGCCT